MDTAAIMKAAVATVGVVQLLKNLIPLKKGKVWSLITIVVGCGIAAIQRFLPVWAMDTIITVSGATLFYDTIYQTFEKIFKGGKSE